MFRILFLTLEVIRGFAGESLSRDIEAQKDRKRCLLQEGLQCDSFSAAKRQRAWLDRGDGKDQKAWRPTQFYRTSAKKWVLALDRQIKTSTCRSGIAFFSKASSADWGSWQSWPWLAIPSDLGSDGVCGFHALSRRFDVNCVLFPDPSHAACRTLDAVLKTTGTWEFWLLLLISWNLEWGPWSDEGRRNQLDEAMEKVYKTHPHEHPLYMSLVGDMVRELEDGEVVLFAREKEVEFELWEFLKQRPRNPVSQRKVALNRFGGAYHASIKSLPWWSVMLWERTIFALESDMLKGAKLADKLGKKIQDAEKASLQNQSTDSRRVSLDDRTLRSCCQNAVAISVLTLMESQHRRTAQIIATCGAPLDAWHTTQNRVLRSSEATSKWLLGQLAGAYMENVAEFLKKLSDVSALAETGFFVGDAADLKSYDNEGLEVLIEDEFADLMGQMCADFARQRMVRGLWKFGWPVWMYHALNSPDHATHVIEKFKQDEANCSRFEARAGKVGDEKMVFKRSLFHTVPVQQLREAFRDTGYRMTPDLASLLTAQSSVNIQTQIVEDLQGEQKADMITKSCRKFRRPARLMARVLIKDVIATRHHFDNVKLSAPKSCASDKLGDESFNPLSGSPSMCFDDIVSTSAVAPWFSPGAGACMCQWLTCP